MGKKFRLKNTGQLFLMANILMKFQNCNLIFVLDTHMDRWMDGRIDKPKATCPFNFFKLGGIKIDQTWFQLSFKDVHLN